MPNLTMKSNAQIKVAAMMLSIGWLCLFILSPGPVMAQGPQGMPAYMGVGGFLDEDGDGFNDLMPDRDGDGVPDALDPDTRGQNADSAFMRQHMYGMPDSGRMMQHMMGDGFMGMGPHGEPGCFGPGDSAMHGGDGHHRGGGDMGGGGGCDPNDSTGMGGGGMGGMGGGKREPAGDNDRQDGHIKSAPAENLNPATGEINKSGIKGREAEFKRESKPR